MTEECARCGETTPFDDAVHVLIHPGGDDGAFDRYVCRRCYESELEPLFDGPRVE